MLKNCQICGNEFEAIRVSAKFCSEACKQRNKRIDNVSPDTLSSVSEVSVSNVLKSTETDKTKISRTGLNYDWDEVSPILKMRKVPCSGCGEPVWDAANPCLECTKKNNADK